MTTHPHPHPHTHTHAPRFSLQKYLFSVCVHHRVSLKARNRDDDRDDVIQAERLKKCSTDGVCQSVER